jgi:hypothetical protein
MLALSLALLLAGGSDDSARAQFTACLKTAYNKGNDQKIAADSFAMFAKQVCAAQIQEFRLSVIGYDVKAGWTRKKAEPDADSQVGDYLADWSDRFRDKSSITPSK